MCPIATPPDPGRHRGWSELSGVASPEAPVGIWGLGVEGRANLGRARSLGLPVILVDQAMAGQTVDGIAVSGDADALFGCSVVVKTPGISRYQDRVTKLAEAGIPVLGGHGLWLNEAAADRVAAVTGTKGKSTTVSVVGHLFAGLGIDGAIGGNLGSPAHDPDRGHQPHYWCLELSSYQVTDLDVRPRVSVITSLSPDHVEWHGDRERYYTDKLALATKPPAPGFDPADAVVLLGQKGGDLDARRADLADAVRASGGDVVVVAPDERAGTVAAALGLRGVHNHQNVALALAVIEHLTGGYWSTGDLVEASGGFHGLGSRLATVATVGGVEFVDDCLSTNTLPTIAALDVFANRPTVLIVGGFDRGIDYEPLAARLARSANPTLVLALDEPDNGPTIMATINRHRRPASVTVEPVSSVEAAVDRGFRWAESHGGGVVLLSPAAPTRGQAMGSDGSPIPTRYPNYGAKAAAFAAAVNAL